MDYIAENDYRYATNLLIRANEQYWYPNSGITKDEGWIYVLHDVHVRFSLCILEDLVAKGLQERERLPIAGIISGRKDYLMEMVDQIDKSFDIEQSFCPSYRDYNSPEIEKKAEELASETYGDKRKLIELTYRNVPFGDVLYDDILRGGDVRNRGKIFSCFDMSQEQYRGFIRNALAAIDQAYEIFTAMPPCYLVTTEYFYTKGLYAHVAKALGAKIIITSIDFPDIVTWVNSDHGALSEIKVADMIRAKMEKCLAGYQTNERTPENLFVVDMKSAKKEGQILGLKNGKKNVFILLHAFGDAPREASSLNFYYDSHEWFLDTMRIIQNISNVNWIIKDHPWAAYYKQEDYVKSIFEEYKIENMFWIDNKFSGMNIKEVADCVITAAGDAGIEYWAYGIPTITVGDGYYCNWGISYQMKTLSEYETTLKNIRHIDRPSRQSMELAKRYLTAYKDYYKGDPYSELLRKLSLEEEAAVSKGGGAFGMKDDIDRQMGKATLAFAETYAALLQEKDLRSSAVYRLENTCEV